VIQTRILIVDDHPVVRQGIRMIMNTEPAIQIVGEANDGQEAEHQVRSLRPDIVLLDLAMPGKNGVEAMQTIKRIHPEIRIIVLTGSADEESVNAAMKAGADGYLLKDSDPETLLAAIHAVQRGEMPLHPRVARHLIEGVIKRGSPPRTGDLTTREKEILDLLATGLSNKEMAQILQITKGTVKVYVSKIFRKLDVSNRTEAAIRAKQIGLPH